jgi:hypothetical protein
VVGGDSGDHARGVKFRGQLAAFLDLLDGRAGMKWILHGGLIPFLEFRLG